MLSVDEAHRHLSGLLTLDVGRFFGSAEGLHLGAGLIYENIRVPKLDEAENVFDTYEGRVLVLTHECDVEQGNVRPFNNYTLVCPIIAFDNFAMSFQEEFGEERLLDFLGRLAARDIYRVIYLPHHDGFPHGGLLYLNQITSTHVSAFQFGAARPVCAVTDDERPRADPGL
jgi:hypothetical protein